MGGGGSEILNCMLVDYLDFPKLNTEKCHKVNLIHCEELVYPFNQRDIRPSVLDLY